MYVAERTVEGHRIYAAAIAVERGAGQSELDGFYAGVVVVRRAAGNDIREEVFRDEQLDDGRVWADPEQALQFALEVGKAAIRAQAWLAEQQREQQFSAAESVPHARRLGEASALAR